MHFTFLKMKNHIWVISFYHLHYSQLLSNLNPLRNYKEKTMRCEQFNMPGEKILTFGTWVLIATLICVLFCNHAQSPDGLLLVHQTMQQIWLLFKLVELVQHWNKTDKISKWSWIFITFKMLNKFNWTERMIVPLYGLIQNILIAAADVIDFA